MVLQETADSTDYILKTPNVGLAEVMAHPEVAQYVKSLLVSGGFPLLRYPIVSVFPILTHL